MKKTIALLLFFCLVCSSSYAAVDEQMMVEKLQEIKQLIDMNYYDEVTEQDLDSAIYHGLLNALDKHSVYFSEQELASFNEDISGSFVGVGISVERYNDFIKVIAPLANSPAERAGIKTGDVIIAVDGNTIAGIKLEQVVSKIKGEAGSTVILTIEREGQSEPLNFTLQRALIEINSVTHSQIDGYHVYKIRSFDERTYSDFYAQYSKYHNNKGLIIDLRGNPGGLLNQVVKLADLFIEKGQVITAIDYRHDGQTAFKAKRRAEDDYLVVLVDGGSASAAELFAGAIQDHQRGLVIGSQTYGKGSVQSIFPLQDGSAVKLTIGKYATPNGRYIDGIGITPDSVIEETNLLDPAIEIFYAMNSLKTSQRGSADIDTYGMQQRLHYLAYDQEITGTFDQKTEQNLRDFQKRTALPVSGILDIVTKQRLQQKMLEKAQLYSEDIALQRALEYLKQQDTQSH